ncbi:AAA family ATPase [Acidaminobacter sp. JC074]|uniref:sigma-54 interaction domain-containing protein n=1 Tax=Acidaminobacter sp. JC074 TaxID=2530199 RepID=UPI001F0F45CF|nr:sigma 54-interacting transcriptional regulator [Acidaminobacter sp. JC074]MCH4886835.1 AAA family ATPase [Acidaminobacter sp. JC074]
MKKTIGVITNTNSKVAAHIKSNIESLIGEYVEVRNYYLSNLPADSIDDDVVVVMIKEMGLHVVNQLKNKDALITLQRTVKSAPLLKVFSIPEGMEVLVVNDTYETTLETITLLYQLGVNHVQLVPFQKGMDFSDIKVAITPDEFSHVPDHIQSIINIEQRVIDVSTFIQIMTRLGIDSRDVSKRLLDYTNEIVSLAHGMNKTLLDLYSKHEEMSTLLNLSHDGIILVDDQGQVLQANAAFQDMFECEISYHLMSCFGNKFLSDFSEDAYDECLYTLRDREYLVSKKPIKYYGKSKGFSYIFRDVTHVLALESSLQQQIKTKGLIAKYTFDDILTRSDKVIRTIEAAKRFASADLSIMITGESGTGKELFAQSIHNDSERAKYPFVAVNCAAMTESLLESELFGYEGGAFTGALKQGKQGLFERANRGTIFLDEIGDMPLSMQSKLLRVLQEHQVMRVGGKEVIDVDVRVIAATHKDLYELVERNEFRQDLYFRINVLPLEIPSLRERPEDILLLLEDFSTESYHLTDSVKDFLVRYPWKGNIREIKNISQYLSFMRNDCLDIDDLPPYMRRVLSESPRLSENNDKYSPVFIKVMLSLYLQKKWAGRQVILKGCHELGGHETEADIRRFLQSLKEEGYLTVREGRGGSQLNVKGYDTLS